MPVDCGSWKAPIFRFPDVDSARMLLHIHGKGNKDRYVPLPEPTIEILREFWCTHRSPEWLFPA